MGIFNKRIFQANMLYYVYYRIYSVGGKRMADITYKSKINKIRTFALSLVFIGFIIMYIGLLFRDIGWLMLTFMLLGTLAIVMSTVIYFWIGMLSTRAVPIICPS